jgi:hypothetical protein
MLVDEARPKTGGQVDLTILANGWALPFFDRQVGMIGLPFWRR